MSRDKSCREKMFVSRLPRDYPHRGGNFERGKMPSLVGGRQFGRHFRRQFGRRQLRVKNCLETMGTIFATRHQDVSQGPLGLCAVSPGDDLWLASAIHLRNVNESGA